MWLHLILVSKYMLLTCGSSSVHSLIMMPFAHLSCGGLMLFLSICITSVCTKNIHPLAGIIFVNIISNLLCRLMLLNCLMKCWSSKFYIVKVSNSFGDFLCCFNIWEVGPHPKIWSTFTFSFFTYRLIFHIWYLNLFNIYMWYEIRL